MIASHPAEELPALNRNKPRIALMGEFSAGKSTLANVLLGRSFSPVKVTATQLPPVWYRQGAGASHRIGLDGERAHIPGGEWHSVSTQDTQMIEIEIEAEILEYADLIDMPGTSDPNLQMPYWKTILSQIDIAVWCTPANQAWRQSEAALWEQAPNALKSRSLLLTTRMDKIRNPADGARILQRVRQETEGAFGDVLPVSLTQAMAAGEDDAALEHCGAAELFRFLNAKIDAVCDLPRPDFVPYDVRKEAPEKTSNVVEAIPDTPKGRIIPRRVISKRVVRG